MYIIYIIYVYYICILYIYIYYIYMYIKYVYIYIHTHLHCLSPTRRHDALGACLKERRATLLAIKAQVPQQDVPVLDDPGGVHPKKNQPQATSEALGSQKNGKKHFGWDVGRSNQSPNMLVMGWRWTPWKIPQVSIAVETSGLKGLGFSTRWSTWTSHSIGRGKAKLYKTSQNYIGSIGFH